MTTNIAIERASIDMANLWKKTTEENGSRTQERFKTAAARLSIPRKQMNSPPRKCVVAE
jgi:hypothetical protein